MRDPSSAMKSRLVMRAIVAPFDRPDAVLGGSTFTLNGRNRRIGGMRKTLVVACSVALSPLLLLAQGPAGQQGARGGRGRGTPAPPSYDARFDRTVTFRLRAPEATSVSVSGDFADDPQAMTKGTDGVWTATAGPLRPLAGLPRRFRAAVVPVGAHRRGASVWRSPPSAPSQHIGIVLGGLGG